MPLTDLPLELVLLIADNIRDDDGELRYYDFNSLQQVNSALFASLNHKLWKEAAQDDNKTALILTHLIDGDKLSGIRRLLELGANIEVRLPAFDVEVPGLGDDAYLEFLEPTLLLLAADTDNLPLARLLLDKGAKVEYVVEGSNSRYSPMHAARSAEMVDLLLDHNADPEWEDDVDRRPLHLYARREDIRAMGAILQRGAEVNAQDYYGLRPVHEAARRSLTAVELLVTNGADVTQRDQYDNTPLILAAKAGKLDVVDFLVETWPAGMMEGDGVIVQWYLEQGVEALNND
jgi:ankyrin repeat protein